MAENIKEKNSFSFRCGQVTLDAEQMQAFARDVGASTDRCRRFFAAYMHEMSKDAAARYQEFIDNGDAFEDFRNFCSKINKSAGTVRVLTPEEKELKELRERVKVLRKEILSKKSAANESI